MESRDSTLSKGFGQGPGRYRYEHTNEFDDGTAHLDVHVTEAIATAAGVDATELRIPLWNVIDVDALTSLFDGSQSGTVTFTYGRYHVRVDVYGTGGAVTVSTPAPAAD